MKVLIADKLPSSSVQALEALGLSTSLRPELTADELPSVIAGVHVLVVRSTRVTAATFEAADALQLVIRAGAGTNTIDCAKRSCKNGWLRMVTRLMIQTMMIMSPVLAST